MTHLTYAEAMLAGLVQGVTGSAPLSRRLAWMIVLATIPVGIAGLALAHLFRVVFSKPGLPERLTVAPGRQLSASWSAASRLFLPLAVKTQQPSKVTALEGRCEGPF
jgi:undecaprenyl pyrophosphate phosphatase UppP